MSVQGFVWKRWRITLLWLRFSEMWLRTHSRVCMTILEKLSKMLGTPASPTRGTYLRQDDSTTRSLLEAKWSLKRDVSPDLRGICVLHRAAFAKLS